MAKVSIKYVLNEQIFRDRVRPGMTLLDFLRNEKGLFGSKEGCREGECGACTVLIGSLRNDKMEYKAVPSCLTPLVEIDGKHIVTIEGLSAQGATPLQNAFVDNGATQCGFCTPGFIMAATGYLLCGETLTVQEALDALDGNICRCTGYASIKRAVTLLFDKLDLQGRNPAREELIEKGIIPSFFNSVIPDIKRTAKKKKENQPGQYEMSPLVAGGTDLYIQRGDELAEGTIQSLSPLNTPQEIFLEDGTLRIPGSCSFETFRTHPIINQLFPGMKEKLKFVASHILRNRATLAGNVVNASPIADLAVILISMEASAVIDGLDEERVVSLDRFYMGYKKMDLHAGERIREFIIPADTLEQPNRDAGDSDNLSDDAAGRRILWNFEKVSKRAKLDIATCNSSLLLRMRGHTIERAVLAVGGVAPIPYCAVKVNEILKGYSFKEALMDETMFSNMKKLADTLKDEIAPISDIRGGREYKLGLIQRMIFAHFLALFPDLLSFEMFPEIASGNAEEGKYE